MCGRFAIYSIKMTPEAFEARFGFPMPDIYKQPLSYNIGPYRDIPAIYTAQGGETAFREMYWQLIPSFAPEFKSSYSMFNSRAESFDKTGFKRTLLARQRCVVLLNDFFEWRKEGGGKMPYRFSLTESPVMTLAGIYSIWRGPDSPERYSCSLITVPANEAVKGIHQRMPVILTPEDERTWLDGSVTEHERLRGVLRPSEQALTITPVSPEVNNIRNDYPELLERVKR